MNVKELYSIAENKDLLSKQAIFVYGDGLYGSMVCRYLSSIGLQVTAVLVTDISGKPEVFHGIRIASFESQKMNIGGNTIILAMSGKNCKAVRHNVLECFPDCLIQIAGNLYQEMLSTVYGKLPVSRNKLFVSCFFGAGGFRDSPRAVVEEIQRRQKAGDKVAANIQIVWDLIHPESVQMPEEIKIVKQNSDEYLREVNTSGILLTNDGPGVPGLVKSKQQFLINTWHGNGPFKTIYATTPDFTEDIRQALEKSVSEIDAMICAAGQYHEAYRNAFLYRGKIYDYGYPRNDVLLRDEKREERKREVRKQFHITDDEKIFLYAPTFRKDVEESFQHYDLDMARVQAALQKRFGKSFVLFYRFHRFTQKYMKENPYYPDAIDVCTYPDMMDLLAAADVLITDYSSSMWDYSLMYRPVFLYHNDVKEYEDDRGFFWPPERWPYPKAHSTEEMCEQILNFNEDAYHKALDRFFEEDPSYDDGHASERVVDLIEDVMTHPEKYGKA